MKLFYNPGACSLASHIALLEAGATVDLVRIDLKAGAQRQPDFLAINPKGRVPALTTGGETLTESTAILTYAAMAFPQAGLAPLDDAMAFAKVQAFNAFLASSVHVTFALERRGERYADDEAARQSLARKAPSTLDQHFALIEAMLADGRPFVHGTSYTISDPYLFLFSRWYDQRGYGSKDKTPNVYAHLQRIGEREATKAAIAAEEG